MTTFMHVVVLSITWGGAEIERICPLFLAKTFKIYSYHTQYSGTKVSKTNV